MVSAQSGRPMPTSTPPGPWCWPANGSTIAQYLAQGLQVASAVLANETAEVAGTLQLVAGPWGRSSPAVADPSYFSVEAMDVTGERVGRSALVRARPPIPPVLVAALTGSGRTLPSDWVDIRARRLRPGGR